MSKTPHTGARKKDALALDYLRHLAATTRISPTNDELMHVIKGGSWATSSVCIARLEAAGLIEVRRTSRSRVIVIDGVELAPPQASPAGEGKTAPTPKRRRDGRRVVSTIGPMQPVAVLPLPESLTALLCGDPLPGRSAKPARRSSTAYRAVPVGTFALGGGCRFIAGKIKPCGAPRVDGSPYCGAHHALCYEKAGADR